VIEHEACLAQGEVKKSRSSGVQEFRKEVAETRNRHLFLYSATPENVALYVLRGKNWTGSGGTRLGNRSVDSFERPGKAGTWTKWGTIFPLRGRRLNPFKESWKRLADADFTSCTRAKAIDRILRTYRKTRDGAAAGSEPELVIPDHAGGS
jgi:hypothetical protein